MSERETRKKQIEISSSEVSTAGKYYRIYNSLRSTDSGEPRSVTGELNTEYEDRERSWYKTGESVTREYENTRYDDAKKREGRRKMMGSLATVA